MEHLRTNNPIAIAVFFSAALRKRDYFILLLLFLLLACTSIGTSSCTPKGKETFSEKAWKAAVESTDAKDLYASNRNENGYYCPWMRMDEKSFIDVIKWKLSPEENYTEDERNYLPDVLPDTAQRLSKTKGDFILWIGHNTFLIRVGELYWLTDPVFSKRALLPARKTPPAITIEELNNLFPAPHIIISHNHYDHLDRFSMEHLPQTSPVFVPAGLEDYVKKMNKPNTHEMDWWEERDLGNGIRLVCLPAQHWSMRINQGRNQSLWASWLLMTPEKKLYFGGDSGYFKGFAEIGKRWPGIDYAFMATTAYHPRWFMHFQHMNIEEAVRGFKSLGAKYFIPTQWGTFHLGDEPAGYPGLDLNRYIQIENLEPERYMIMDIGEIVGI